MTLDVPRLQPAGGYQFSPAVASGGGQVFVAWSDGRALRGAYYGIYGARVSVDAGIVDRPSLVLDTPPTLFGSGAGIAYSQGRFMVTWLDDGPYHPWYRLFGTDGQPVGDAELLLASSGSYGGYPTVSAADDHFLAAWGEYDGPASLGLAVVSANGTRTTPDGGVGIGSLTGSNQQPRATWVGGSHVVAWLNDGLDGGLSLAVTTVTVDAGVPLASAERLLAGPQGVAKTPPALAASGGWHALAFAAAPPRTPGVELSVAAPTAALGPAGRLLSTAGAVRDVALVPTPTGYLLLRTEASSDGGAFVAARALSLDGTTLGAEYVVATLARGGEVAASPTATGAYAVWTDSSFVMGAPLALDGQPRSAPERLAWGANSQLGPSLAVRDGGFLVGWYDDRADAPGLRVSRVSAVGVVESPAGVVVPPAAGQASRSAGFSAMVSTPTGHWLLASDSQAATLHAFTPDGDLVPSRTRLVSGSARDARPPVPYRDGFAFALGDMAGNGALFRVAGDGSFLDGDAGRPLPSDTLALFTTALGSTGQRLLLVEDQFTFIRLRWLEDDGGIGDAGFFTRPNSLGWVDALSGAGEVLVVEVPLNPNQLRILRIREDGAWVDAAPVTIPLDAGTGPGNGGFSASGSWNGNGWDLVVPWGRNGAGPSALVSVPLTGAPSPARWLQDGVSAAVGDGRGRVLAASEAFDATAQVRGNRVTLMLVSDAPLGSGCLADAACTSGHCVEGVCCDSVCGGGALACETCLASRGAVQDGRCGVAQPGVVCRAATGACDAEERCDGLLPSCPADVPAADGAPCAGGVCGAGVCLADDGGAGGGAGGGSGGGAGSTSADGGATGPLQLRVGCGCTGAPLEPLGLALALLALRRRSPRQLLASRVMAKS